MAQQMINVAQIPVNIESFLATDEAPGKYEILRNLFGEFSGSRIGERFESLQSLWEIHLKPRK